MKIYKCRLCGGAFHYLIIHLHKDEKILEEQTKKMFSFSLGHNDIKEDHLKLYNKIENSYLYGDQYYKENCFCGGRISIFNFSNSRWLHECDNCGFVWDED